MGSIRKWPVGWSAKGKKLRFALGAYDHSKTLVIDPVLVFSMTLGSSNGNNGSAITSVETDSAGFIYITGNTAGTDFPATAGAFDTNPVNLSQTASFVNFVAKMDPSASTLLYSDFLVELVRAAVGMSHQMPTETYTLSA